MGKSRYQRQQSKTSGGPSDTDKKSRVTYSDKEKRRQVDNYLEAKEKDKKLSLRLFASRINVPLQTFHKWTERLEYFTLLIEHTLIYSFSQICRTACFKKEKIRKISTDGN